MIFRSMAPLRIGFAGGGTDVSPFCDVYGGSVLNATINMYAYCTLEVTNSNTVEFYSYDTDEKVVYESREFLNFDGKLDIFKGVYNRIVKDFTHRPLSFRLTTHSDAVRGSGLGGSSTLVVAVLKAFTEWLNLPLGEYDAAHLAYEIERLDVNLSGGKQDQYAATFGGFNFIEFYENDKVIVNPLRIKNWIKLELESSLLLYFSGVSRDSSIIIDEQIKNTREKNHNAIESMQRIKQDSVEMKEALLTGRIDRFAEILDHSWVLKKRTAHNISNAGIDKVVDDAKSWGAMAGKVSGAGGGGFIMFIVDPVKKPYVAKKLSQQGGLVHSVKFTEHGTSGWKI